MADIFISYSQKDRAWVKRLVDALTAEGWEVWWDLKIRAGESFDQVIEHTLEHVSCVVGVWSSNSVKSEWVRAESAWAKDCDRFVSIRIDNDLQLPLKFYHVHTANMAGWDGSRKSSSFRSLVRDISSLAPLPESDKKHPDPLSTFQDHLHDGGEGPKMVVIPAGSFWMGSPPKEHKKTEAKLLRPIVAGLPIQNDGCCIDHVGP